MYVLHAIPDWASLIVRLTLEELGQPYTLRLLDREAGDLNSPAYRAMNPHGLVPVLETPDGAMFETGAILLWLADRHGALAPAPGDRERAAFLSWFVFVANSLHPTVMALIHPERPGGEAVSTAVMATQQARLRQHLGHLDRAAATLPQLAGPDTSILAIYVSVLLRWAAIYPPDLAYAVRAAEFPTLAALAARQEARPASVRVASAEELGPMPFSDPVTDP